MLNRAKKILKLNPPDSVSPSCVNRRDFIKTTSLAAGALAFGVPALLRGQNLNSKLNIACIGAMGGKGRSDTDACASENIVALCDVDSASETYPTQIGKYPGAKFHKDFRQMLDQMGSQIDAVTVSTPDHLHAIVASAAMQMHKAVYCQKPLTQTIYEARYLRKLAKEKKVVTQMGNQGSAAAGLRRAVETIQDGLIGQVQQVHVWTNRPVWPQGMDRPQGEDPVPSTLDWDKWIGPAPMRPFKSRREGSDHEVYHPFNWRGWQDFGTGALGDMACHTVNMPFRALNLGYPTEIEAMPLSQMNKESYPVGSKIRFQFPARKASISVAQPHFLHHHRKIEHDALTLWWYDGGQPDPAARGGHDLSNKPPIEVTADIVALRGDVPDSGCLLIGDGGSVFTPDDYGTSFFVKLKDDQKYIHYLKHPAMAQFAERIPRNPHGKDNNLSHTQEWLTAIRENKPELCYSSFEIASRLTEIMLLGCVALRAGRKIEWDGPKMMAKNCPEAAPFIKRENRSGWNLS